MNQNNFNKLISRQNTYSAKWCNSNANVIPLSVADMDISAPDFIINKLFFLSQNLKHVMFPT